MSVRKGTDVIAGMPNDLVNSKANTSLDNLNSVGRNISNWSSNITNCITNISQDIKLELSSGVLKVKSGSKIYVPNGTNTFDIVTLSGDKTVNLMTTTGKTMIFLRNDVSVWGNIKVDNCLSGTTVPSGHTGMFYNTDNNKVYYYSGGQAQGAYFSLPLAVVTSSGGTVTSIDQVFNGFGYIGSIIFVLPGVKGLAPDGRNTDGTLNNYNINTTSVKIANAGNHKFLLNYNGVFDDAYYGNYIEQETMPSVNCTWYKPSANQIYHVLSGVADVKREAMAVDVKTSGGKVTNLKPNLPFRAVDYNDYQKTAEQVNTNTTNIATLGTSKANTSLDNVSAGIDFVIESQLPTAENDYTWYRKYKSGWVEQGGYLPATGSGDTLQTVNLPKAMNDAHYTVTTSLTDTTAAFAPNWGLITVQQQTTTGFKTYTGSDWGKYWQVSGKAA